MGSIYNMLSIAGTKIAVLALCLAKAIIAVEDVEDVEVIRDEAEKLLSSLVSAADNDELFDQNKEVITIENDVENSKESENKKGMAVVSNKSAKLIRNTV